MRSLLIVIVVAALAWSGIWFWGARTLESEIAAALDELERAGWDIRFDSLDVRGFPNRFDTVIDALETVSPGGIAYAAPRVQVMALSYAPNRAILALPPVQRVAGAFGTVEIESETARASLAVRPNTDLSLAQAQAVLEEVTVTSEAGAIVLGALRAAIASDPEAPDTPRIGLALDTALLPQTPGLPEGARRIESAQLDARLGLSAPLDRFSAEAPPTLRSIDIAEAEVDWGGVRLSATGTLAVERDGTIAGELDVTARNWQQLLDYAVAAGLVEAEAAPSIRQTLTLLSLAGGDEDRLEAPVSFRGGRTFLGPLPVGLAPRL